MKIQLSRSGAFSIASSIYIMFFLVVNNIVYSSSYPWIIFCIPVFVLWPLAACFPHNILKTPTAFILYACVVVYYAVLNILISPGHPWVLYIAFGFLWYPFSVFFAKKGAFHLSIYGLIWSILFFGIVNLITTPGNIWAVYPVFIVLWWPLSVYFFGSKRTF